MAGSYRTLALVEGTAIAGAIGAVLVGAVVGGASSAAPACGSYPGCLLSPAGLIGAVHIFGAGLLLLLALTAWFLAFLLRSTAPTLLGWATAATVVLFGMAALGSLFAAGALPTTLAPVQYAFLATLVVLDMLLARAADRWRRAGSNAVRRGT